MTTGGDDWTDFRSYTSWAAEWGVARQAAWLVLSERRFQTDVVFRPVLLGNDLSGPSSAHKIRRASVEAIREAARVLDAATRLGGST